MPHQPHDSRVQTEKMRNIVVVSHDPLWPECFRIEAERLAAVLGEELVSIHHIGSTSIPGMCAKPIIDIMPVVRDIRRIENLYPTMVRLGYQPMGEYGIPGRRYFFKGDSTLRTHHIHSYRADHPEVVRHLNFRDYLAAHSDEALVYARLKGSLAAQFRDDINGYMAGKDAFIKDILRKAELWASEAKS